MKKAFPENEAAEADFLSGGGEMGAIMRSSDFLNTSLGPVSGWPASLRAATSICLNSRYPMFIAWGAHRSMLYNDSYTNVLAGKHPWALGQPAQDVWAEIWHILGQHWSRVFNQGEATWAEDLLLVMNRSGYDEETYFTFSYSPIRSEGGAVEGMFCACQETTEKVIGERRLKTLRELAAQTTTANSPEVAVVMAMETLSGNPSDMPFALLYLVEEGSRWAVLAGTAGVDSDRDSGSPRVELDEQDTHGWPLGQVLDTGSSQFMESLPDYFTSTACGPWKKPANRAILLPIQFAAHEKPSGVLIAGVSPVRPVDESYRTFFEVAAGQISSAIANARAYQKERQRAEALAELDRAKTLFFSNVSHEFRTPLSLMLGPIEDLLSQKDTLSPSDYEQIGLVHRNGLRLLKLVNTLMDFSRIEAGRMEAVYEPTDLSALTADLASVFRSAVEKAGMDLLVDCPPLMEPVYVDREMWEKIVLNLLSNAFKFTLEGKIEVGLRRENGNAVLSVRDTGAGIAKEEIPFIFERFHRVKETRVRTLEGTGIGLALVYELVKLHGGKISVENEEGEGSTFTVSIPTGTAHLPGERIEAARSLVSTALGAAPYVEEAQRWLPDVAQTFGSSGFAADSSIPAVSLSRETLLSRSNGPARSRILVADDNADMRDYLRRILSGQYEVLTAANGKEALSLAIEHLPDLILSDIMMPEIDGFELLRTLRASEKTKLVPIILLSARAGEEAKVEGLEAGADDYLIKPFSARELTARVGAQIAMARLQRESRQALSESEERFRALYEHSTDAIVLTDPRHGGKVLTANPAACTLFGWLEAELMGKTREELFDLNDPAIETLVQRRQSAGVARGELTYRRKDGSTFPGEVNTALFTSSHGEPRSVSVIRDMSERKKAEEELERERKQLLAIIESLDEAVGVWNTDGSLVLINDATAKLYGFEMKEQMHRHLSDYADVHVRTMDGCELPQEEWPPSRVLRGETFSNWELEQYIPSINKGFIGSNSGRPVRDANGRVILGVTSVRDITEHKQAEEALRESEERFRLALSATKDAIWDANLITGTVQWNDVYTAAFGRPPETSDSWHWWIDHIHPGDRDRTVDSIEAAIGGQGDLWSCEYRFLRSDGEWAEVHDRAYIARNESGKAVRIVGAMFDMTERKRMENKLREARDELELRVQERTAELKTYMARLEESNQALQDFASIAAHDLQEPLRKVKSFGSMLKQKCGPSLGEQGSDYLERVLAANQRMQSLLTALLEYSRLSTKADPFTQVDLTEVVEGVLSDLEVRIQRTGGEVQVADLPAVQADSTQMRQLFQNLIGNALKFHKSDEKPVVRVFCTPADNSCCKIVIEDNGIGFDEEFTEKIFAPFQRLHGKSSQYEGTGMGLAICRKIVERHGGSIAAKSSPGIGSKFIIILPVT